VFTPVKPPLAPLASSPFGTDTPPEIPTDIGLVSEVAACAPATEALAVIMATAVTR